MKKLLLLAAIFIVASLSAQNNQNPSLASALNLDGTLNTNVPDGSYDVSGFRMVSVPGEAPRFAPVAKSSKAAGDEFWDDPFSPAPGFDNTVNAIAIYSGYAYIGGEYTSAGGMLVNYIAKSSGTVWYPMLTGLTGSVQAIVPGVNTIFIGGTFSNAAGLPNADGIISWSTTTNSWSALGTGCSGGLVYALAITGTNLYVGGSFTSAGGVANTSGFARWSTLSNTWSSLTTSFMPTVRTIAINGNNVYLGGSFTNANGIAAADYIACYNSGTSAWSALSSSPNMYVNVIVIDASGNLFVGGQFTSAGGVTNTSYIAKYTVSTTTWSALGTGVNSIVRALLLDGTTLYVGGDFSSAGGVTTQGIAKYNTGTSVWSALLNGLSIGSQVRAIAKLNVSTVLVGGWISTIDGATMNHIARWNPSTSVWMPMQNAFDNPVNKILVRGNEVYFAGGFYRAAGNKADKIVKWNKITHAWTSFDSLNYNVESMAFDSAGTLYIGGNFQNASNNPNADYFAKWDATTSHWVPVGSGFSCNGIVYDIATAGTDVYIAGMFTSINGNSNCQYVARWNGVTWSALGSGLNNKVDAISFYNNKLYIAGMFTDAGGIANADYLCAYNLGTNSYEAVGGGSPDWYCSDVYADSTGVYVGGSFGNVNSVPANMIAKFNFTSWTALGSGLNNSPECIFRKGSDLYVGGAFTTAGGSSANYITRWDGSAWNTMGSGCNSTVLTLASDDSTLYVGGSFQEAGGKPAVYAARYSVLPYLTSQSYSHSVCPGTNVVLSVTAHGTPTLQYQWYRNSSILPGATGSTYTIVSANASNIGNYTCTVSNGGGNTNSALMAISLFPALNAGTVSLPSGNICEGMSAQLSVSATGGGLFSYQWQLNGSNIPGETSSVYSIVSATTSLSGSYSCVVTDTCTTATSGPVTLSIHALPNISAVASNSIICPGNSSTLTASGGSSYIWTPATGLSSTTTNPAIASPPASITYTVSGTDSWGCANTNTVVVNVKQPVAEQLCMVTQDTAIKKCVVVWEKTPSAGIREYKVLRESTTTNVYNLIGTVKYDSLSAFVDTSSHPEAYSHRYRIIAVDTCGNNSDTSTFHRTMHLNVNYSGTPGTYNLIWDAYQGFSFPSYEVYRGTTPSNLALIFTLPSSTPSVSDGGAPLSGDVYYWVKIVKNDSCVATSAAKASSTTYSTSVSNMEQYKIIGVEENAGMISFSIFPNPANDILNIKGITGGTLYISDATGRTVIDQVNTGSVNVSQLERGIYFVSVQTEQGRAVRRFVKE